MSSKQSKTGKTKFAAKFSLAVITIAMICLMAIQGTNRFSLSDKLMISANAPTSSFAMPTVDQPGPSIKASGPLRVSRTNPNYLEDGNGNTILLVGAHTWYVWQDAGETDPPPTFNYDAFLDRTVSLGYNFFRGWTWEQSSKTAQDSRNWWISPTIYSRPGPGMALDGKLKYDLSTFNQAYFDRLRERVIQAGNHGIYVSEQLFQGWSLESKGQGGNPWPGHPFNVNNNINGINGDLNNYGNGQQVTSLNIPAITALQEAYVRKVVDTVNDLDNIVYEICNEATGDQDSADWSNHFIDYVHYYEAHKPNQHLVWYTVDFPGGDNSRLFSSNAEIISPSSEHDIYIFDPPAATGNKVIVADTDHLYGIGGDSDWAWKSFCRGLNPIFMDTYSNYDEWNGSPPEWWDNLRMNLSNILAYSKKIDLSHMTPQDNLASTGYCLAKTGNGAQYLVYIPAGGTVSVDLTGASGQLLFEWYLPYDGSINKGGVTTGGMDHTFTSPSRGDAVLYIHSQDSR